MRTILQLKKKLHSYLRIYEEGRIAITTREMVELGDNKKYTVVIQLQLFGVNTPLVIYHLLYTHSHCHRENYHNTHCYKCAVYILIKVSSPHNIDCLHSSQYVTEREREIDRW